jgi:hypothetical protein
VDGLAWELACYEQRPEVVQQKLGRAFGLSYKDPIEAGNMNRKLVMLVMLTVVMRVMTMVVVMMMWW